jgi:hypothetical protein
VVYPVKHNQPTSTILQLHGSETFTHYYQLVELYVQCTVLCLDAFLGSCHMYMLLGGGHSVPAECPTVV